MRILLVTQPMRRVAAYTCENSKLPVGGLLAISDEHVILPRLHVEVLHLQGDNLALGIPQNVKEIARKKFVFIRSPPPQG
jgi:hypothetical protein